MAGRSYAIVAPEFWTGDTGIAIRAAGPVASLVALYLITNPHANMTGLYRLAPGYAAADTGLTPGQFSEALTALEGVGFAEVDGPRCLVWVREMGKYQVGAELKPGDKRRKWVDKALAPARTSPLYARFFERYGVPWGLQAPSEDLSKPLRSPLLETGKPLRSQEQDQLTASGIVSDPPSADPQSKAKPSTPQGSPEVREVLDAMRDGLRELDPKAKGPRDNETNRKLIRAPMRACGATVDDWKAVIAAKVAECRARPESRTYLRLSTLGRPANFQRALDDIDSGAPAGKPAETRDISKGYIREETFHSGEEFHESDGAI